MPKVSFLLIGDELTTGAIFDKNGAYLARELTSLGLEVLRFSVVRDRVSEIQCAVNTLAEDSDIIISTGGLGPTTDDITRQAIALAARTDIVLCPDALRRMEEKYAARGIPLNRISERQAEFPNGAEILLNPAGTADAFACLLRPDPDRTVYIVALPGVVRETKQIYLQQLKPWLLSHYNGLSELQEVSLNCFGLSESYIGTKIEEVEIPRSVRIAYRPIFPEVRIRLRADDTSITKEGMHEVAEKLKDRIGREFVFGTDCEEGMAGILASLLTEKKLTLSLAESCTGGLAAHKLVSISGASAFLHSAIVSYSDKAKEKFLDVPEDVILTHGAVSKETVIAMAKGLRLQTDTDICVSVTGVAGPGGGTPEKPAGTVWFGLSTRAHDVAVKFFFPFDRNRFREYCAELALDLVRREILGYELFWERR